MGQELERAGWARVCVCVCLRVTSTDSPWATGEAERHTSCRGCRVSQQGSAAGEQRGACAPLHGSCCSRWHKHAGRHATPRPTLLSCETGVGVAGVGGWGLVVGGVGTPCSSKTPLMHNSCASIEVAILIFHKAFKINRISQRSAFSHTALQEIT